MVRLPRSFLLLICSTFTLSTITSSFAGERIASPDCLSSVLSYIEGNGSRGRDKEILIGLANYNDDITKTFKSFDEFGHQNKINQAIDRYADYDHEFNADTFKSWIKENPGAYKDEDTLGKYLQERVDLYSKTHPVKKIKTSELAAATEEIAKKCGQDVVCNEKGIAKFFSSRMENFCLRNQPKLVQDMILSMAVMVAGYSKYAHDHPADGFPYDLLINNLFWTPVMQELGCRQAMGSQKIGRRVDFDQPITKKEFWSRTGSTYVTFLRTSPMYQTSYVALNLGRHLITGQKKIKEEDVTWENFFKWGGEYAKQIGVMTLYDASISIPRNVLLLDPVNKLWAPRIQRGLRYGENNRLQDNPNMSTVPSWMLSKNIYSKAAIGVPQTVLKGLSSWSFTEVFKWWQGQADDSFVNTHFHGFQKPTPSPSLSK
jgi:hypothetical protein